MRPAALEKAEMFRFRSCTRKKRYDTEIEANKAEQEAFKPLKAYECRFCEGWHLTSKK